MPNKQTLLCILDGFGINPNPHANAVAMANKPNIDQLMASCPNTQITTFGEAVGLPEGQMGNSEVGHLNIGAGRVVEQWLLRIGRALSGDFLDQSKVYKEFLTATKTSPTMHVIGLYSDGGVHSQAEHLILLLKRLRKDHTGEILLHVITDGRDTSPFQAKDLVVELEKLVSAVPGCAIATISGRFFAMDRDKRWERTEAAVNAIALGKGEKCQNILDYILTSYKLDITDEFIKPAVILERPIQQGDALVFWNFREDRMRQLVKALCINEFEGFSRSFPIVNKTQVLCFTEYDHTFHLPFLFPILDIKNHLGQWVSSQNLKQLRVAETEKYPHVTYFFNGGIEPPYPGEDRQVVPSPRDVKTYDQKPEMSAFGVCDIVCKAIDSNKYDLIVVNFANCDMVGHTGVIDATVKAVETVDTCLGRIIEHLRKVSGQALIIADHGNAEQLVNYVDGTPHTSHTTYPVPAILFGYDKPATLRTGAALCDIAPTILKMMNLPVPSEMSGKSLF